MPIPGNFNNALVNAAHGFAAKGWSVIPLRGITSPQSPKLPAIPTWKPYQTRKPSSQELAYWFEDCGHMALGIVLGKVSGLVVLDIDDPTRDEDFRQSFPEYTDTFVVRSGNRNLPHYYFAIESGTSVPNRNRAGAELRGDGCYVVAPETRIGEREWSVENTRDPMKLDETDLRRIIAWIDGHTSVSTGKRENPLSGAKSGYQEVRQAHQPGAISSTTLIRLYQRLVVKYGRNNALYRTACFAHGSGLSAQQIENALLDTHISHPPVFSHQPETPLQRKAEGLRTIQSATAQPAVLNLNRSMKRHRQLSNALREWFLANDLVNVARVLDGLLMCGVKPGQMLTAAEIYDHVEQFGIGRNSVYKVLKCTLADGKPIFETYPPQTPPTAFAYAGACAIEQTKQCLFGGDSNRVKTIGRPKSIYVIPDPKALCEHLQLDHQRGDRLDGDALASPAKYRQALHAALIARSPGQYPRRWLAERLGISSPTCRRYDESVGVTADPVFEDQVIDWQDVDRRIPEEAEHSVSLQDDTGKSYPALRSLARKLLAAGRRLVLRRQLPNYYRLAPAVVEVQPDMPMAEPVVESPSRGLATAKENALSWLFKSVPGAEAPAQVDQVLLTAQSVCADHGLTLFDKAQPSRKEQDLPTTEEIVYRKLRELSPTKSLTRKRIVDLISAHGDRRVMEAFKQLSSRSSLTNPAGYFIALLNGSSNPLAAKRVESHAEWQERITTSKYAAFYANAGDL